MKDKEEKYRPITNRLLGLAKATTGLAYWVVTVSSGPVVPIFFALVGAAPTITGFAIKFIGEKMGSRKAEKFGADMQDIGIKILASPIWVSCFALDGVGNMITGSKKNWLSEWNLNIKKVEKRHAEEDFQIIEHYNKLQNERAKTLNPQREQTRNEIMPPPSPLVAPGRIPTNSQIR